ncbi:hypothetical protein Acr_00g0050620 [Actinidia rufa]|uniref:Uncharacterized protein n=1 Tax=Actinidia rufa TaxID=165716 RepID=A0A7J0DM68_9ERIC|nr:hypothetical protein Acr_00g0050620 [Actinidia rufa]
MPLIFSPTTLVSPSHARGTSLLDTGMELNWAQLLVHDDEALARFCADHRIPDDVVIERPRPNDDADWVEGKGNRIPIRTWFIHQAELRFSLSKLLKIVISLYGLTFMQVSEFPTGELDPFSVPRHRGYVPVVMSPYRYTIPLRATRQGRPVLPPLQVRGQALRPRSSLSDEVSDLFEGTLAELRRLLEEAQGESSDSNELTPLVPVLNLTILPSSNSDIAIIEPRVVVEHSYTHSDNSSHGSVRRAVFYGGWQTKKETANRGNFLKKRGKGAGSAIGTPELWTPQFTAVEIGKHVTSADTSKDHETCVALGNAVMLPQDVADHAVETTIEFREASDLKAFVCGEVYKKLFYRAFERVRDVYEKQLAELCPGIFQEGWLTCLKELKVPLDHPAWSSPTPPVQPLAFPERYSPIILLDFNEEEYATLPIDGGNVNIAVAEARADVEGTVDGDRASQVEGDRDGEAEDHAGLSTCIAMIRDVGVVVSRNVVVLVYTPTSTIEVPFSHHQASDRYSARAGGLVELASPSPSAFAEYRSLVGTLPYLEATIHKAAALLAVLDDQSVVPLSFRMEG